MIQFKIKTEYSFGETYAPIHRIIEKLKEQKCTSAAIVDSNTWGHIAWHKACRDAGIKPILGVELHVVFDEVPKRMFFIARTQRGLSELYQFSSRAHAQSIKTKTGMLPVLYRDDVRAITRNIIKFAGDVTDADFLGEIQAVIDISPASRVLNFKKKQIALDKTLLIINTSDNAYSFEEDRSTFEIMSSSNIKQTPQHILDEADGDDSYELDYDIDDYDLPSAPMIRASGSLEEICRAGIAKRRLHWTDEYETRLKYELDLIRSKDFESYFIIVEDMVRYAKANMLVGPSRGSAAGSLVCYVAGITEIDPIPAGLYFERFIDVTRTDLPDIDLDFPDNKRQLVFDYMSEKYGDGKVAHIGTVSTYRARSALVQVCKALNISPKATGAIKASIIDRPASDSRYNLCLEDTFTQTDSGKSFIKEYPQAKAAALIEGHASHSGVHAAGLLISNDDIRNYATVDANGIAQIDKYSAEKLGLLKIDVLGLRTLTILEDSGVDIDWYNLPLDDAKTYDVFNQNLLCGIFQFEGGAMREISRQIKFSSLKEIDAVTALARPGPLESGVAKSYVARKNGGAYSAIHPLVEKHMRETYGLPIYQEQTLAIVREIGLFDWVETSAIRKAMSKSLGAEFFESYYKKFLVGAMSQDIKEQEARAIWELINSMGSWQMNRAHTYSYAVISYWTAYLKANYPLEFAAANLRNAKDEESAIMLLREMSNAGIKYCAFDVEKSELNWCVKNGELLGGFTALKGIGESKALKLIEARNNNALTEKQKNMLKCAENPYNDIFPLRTRYESYYSSLEPNIASKVYQICDFDDISHDEERVFIAELLYKNQRNTNDEVNLKKRNGKMETGQLEYIDVKLKDDTGTIGGRISRWDYARIGKDFMGGVQTGAHLLIRAKFFNKIRYAFIKKWRRLDE